MDQYNDPDPHPIEDAMRRTQIEFFAAIHKDHGNTYAVCDSCLILDNKPPLIVPVVITHHRDKLHLICQEHYTSMCQHSGALIHLSVFRIAQPLRIYSQ